MVLTLAGNWIALGEAAAQDGWNPFAEQDARAERRAAKRRRERARKKAAERRGATDNGAGQALAPMNGTFSDEREASNSGRYRWSPPRGQQAAPQGWNAAARAVEQSELPPIPGGAAPDGQSRGAPPASRASAGSRYGNASPPPYDGRLRDFGRADQERRNAPGAAAPSFDRESREGADPFRDFGRRGNAPNEYGAGNAAPRGGRQVSRRVTETGLDSIPLPRDLWRGVNLKDTQSLLAGLDIPPKPAATHRLWRQLWLSPDQPIDDRHAGGSGQDYFLALRLEALYRSGLVSDVVDLISRSERRGGVQSPLIASIYARALIGLGRRKEGCRYAKAANRPDAGIPAALRGKALLVMGYCAAARGARREAGLAADLARETGVRSPIAFAVMDAVANGSAPELEKPERMTLIDYRFLKLASSATPFASLADAEPALLAAVATDPEETPLFRLAAAERAARQNAISAAVLGDVYRAQVFNPADIADPLPTRSEPPLRRALLLQAIEHERDSGKLAGLLTAFYDLARKDGLRQAAAELLLRPLGNLRDNGQLRGFSDAAAEIAIVGGDYALASRWAATGSTRAAPGGYNAQPAAYSRGNAGAGNHWQALREIAAGGGSGGYGAPAAPDFASLEGLARQGRLSSLQLHRLATVLDALEYNVPIPLWEAASRTPQPSGGHLPETGVLPQLAAAAKRGEPARTMLLALKTLGPKGAAGANVIALGDAIRALKRVGLEAHARRLALSALIDDWPRERRR